MRIPSFDIRPVVWLTVQTSGLRGESKKGQRVKGGLYNHLILSGEKFI